MITNNFNGNAIYKMLGEELLYGKKKNKKHWTYFITYN